MPHACIGSTRMLIADAKRKTLINPRPTSNFARCYILESMPKTYSRVHLLVGKSLERSSSQCSEDRPQQAGGWSEGFFGANQRFTRQHALSRWTGPSLCSEARFRGLSIGCVNYVHEQTRSGGTCFTMSDQVSSYRIIPYHIMSYNTIPHHITSNQNISYRITSHHIISPHIISYHIISYHIISYHIISYHIISYHILSYHIISYHIILYHIMSCHITSYHTRPSHTISYHITSYRTILSYHIMLYHIISYVYTSICT